MSIRVETTVSGPGPGDLRGPVQEICRNTLAELFGRYQASFNPSAWNWPRETQRRVGKAGSPRNIVDRGTLRQSGTYTFPDAFSMEARWSANYATAVHEGARLRNGTILPARPWTDAVRGTVQASGIPPYPLGERLQQRILRLVARS
jgi:hypothetical protein